MLLPQYEPPLAARTREELEARLLKSTVDVGLRTYGLSTFVNHPDGAEQRGNLHNTQEVYLDEYLDLEVAKTDPVMQHCRDSAIPIIWNRETCVKAGQAQMHEQMTAAGLEAIARLTLPPPQAQVTIHPTHREAEVLNGSMDGETAWEIGNILKVSERTTTMYIANAMRKLCVVKRSQAVLTAYQLGLLA